MHLWKAASAYCQANKTGGLWILLEKKKNINVFKLKAAKYEIWTFTQLNTLAKSIIGQMDNTVALPYLIKLGVTKNKVLSHLSKDIWDIYLKRGSWI